MDAGRWLFDIHFSIGFLIGAVVTYFEQRQKIAETPSANGMLLSIEIPSNTSLQSGGGVIYGPVVEPECQPFGWANGNGILQCNALDSQILKKPRLIPR